MAACEGSRARPGRLRGALGSELGGSKAQKAGHGAQSDARLLQGHLGSAVPVHMAKWMQLLGLARLCFDFSGCFFGTFQPIITPKLESLHLYSLPSSAIRAIWVLSNPCTCTHVFTILYPH